MRELSAGLRDVIRAREPFALATSVAVEGSAPRLLGTAMAVTADGRVVGSLSGGCVEAAVYDAALDVLAGALPARLAFGSSDGDGPEIGLTCGGRIEVVVRRITAAGAAAVEALLDAIDAGLPGVAATIVDGPAPLGALLAVSAESVAGTAGSPGLDAAITAAARDLLAGGTPVTRRFGPAGECADDQVTVLLHPLQAPPQLLLFGATDYTAALVKIGKLLGYRVTVCDARPVFATERRFPEADAVVCAWPHDLLARTPVDERTAICVLTHDHKFDVPLLSAALRSAAGYVGAMGSRRTHADRLQRLRDAGVTPGELARLRSPIGLDLGGGGVEATAVAIAAEIIRDAAGGSGRPLSEVSGPIHRGREALTR